MSTPGRLSGVSSGGTDRSIAASAGAIMTLVANPVAMFAATKAQFAFSAVISTLAAQRGNISANVSTIVQTLPVCGDFTMNAFVSLLYFKTSSFFLILVAIFDKVLFQ
jgi:hypothetical protein